MAGRLLLRRVLVGHSEYALPVEPMGKRGGTQIQEAPETNWLQMPGHFATSARKNWWEKPSTGKFLTFRWSVPIPILNALSGVFPTHFVGLGPTFSKRGFCGNCST